MQQLNQPNVHRIQFSRRLDLFQRKLRAVSIFLYLFGYLFFFAAHAPAQPDYDAADQRALHAPPEAATSIKRLAAYLTESFSRSDEKARAIFRWMAENIDYDVKEFFSGTIGRRSSGDVLKSHKAVCEGYSGLFEQLARASGLEVASISGFAKGYGYAGGGKLSAAPNHAWNAVKIGGEWKLVDCTWGAGHVGDSRDYVRKFSPHYFFTPPTEFFYDHFPEDPHWQLLDPPRSKNDYIVLVYLRPKYFSVGMHDISEPNGIIETDGEKIIRVQAPENVLCMATLEQKGRMVHGNYVFVQRNGNAIEIRIQPPDIGDFVLRVFAKSREEEGNYEWAAEYAVRARALPDLSQAYPQMYSGFGEHGAVLASPFHSRIMTGTLTLFRITVARADDVALIQEQEWTHLKKSGSVFEATIRARKGLIRLGAQFSGRRDYETLLEYNGVDK